MQMDMFRSDDLNVLISRMDMLEKSLTKVRKGMFARLTNTDKYATETRDHFEMIERDMYRLKQSLYVDDEKIVAMVNQ